MSPHMTSHATEANSILGARRLLTYRRRNDRDVDQEELLTYKTARTAIQNGSKGGVKGTADDLNAFRRKVCSFVSATHHLID